jgi:SAM-dependent methyltransferase
LFLLDYDSGVKGPAAQVAKALPSADIEQCRRMRQVFAAANYTDAEIVKLLGSAPTTMFGTQKLPWLLRRTGGGTSLETLIRLFILGQPASSDAVRAAIAPMTVDEWVEIGLLTLQGAEVKAELQMRCFQDMIVAYDFVRGSEEGLRPDFVMGVSLSSLFLAGLTVRQKNHQTLDLGCGCGIQAFLAAKHSERVVATDLSPRAIAVTRFNAQLNAIPNVECLQGDMFAPVEGRTFDLIVSNPPFVISPDSVHLFLNPGVDGDGFCRRLTMEAPHYLSEGGFCVFNANWAITGAQHWRERPTEWLHGSGCDAWVLHQNTRTPSEYAEFFIETGYTDAPDCSQRFDRWLEYYAGQGITGIAAGNIIMRRRSAKKNWLRMDELPKSMSTSNGAEVLQLFQLRDFLERTNRDDVFLQARFKLAPDVRLERAYEASQGEWRRIAGRIIRTTGFQYSAELDDPSAAILAHCDGQHTVSQLLEEVAAVRQVELTALTPMALGIFRRMLDQGFLIPVGEKAPSIPAVYEELR